jgi:hypothetical protein
MPPSPLFITELLLVKSAGPLLGGVSLVLLFIVFAGMTNHAMSMVMGSRGVVAGNSGEFKVLEKLAFVPGFVLSGVIIAGSLLIAAVVAVEFNWIHL